MSADPEVVELADRAEDLALQLATAVVYRDHDLSVQLAQEAAPIGGHVALAMANLVADTHEWWCHADGIDPQLMWQATMVDAAEVRASRP